MPPQVDVGGLMPRPMKAGEASVRKFASVVARLEVDNGVELGVVQGQLMDERAIEKVERHVADAVANGAKVVVGGNRHALGRTFYEPSIGINSAMPGTEVAPFGGVKEIRPRPGRVAPRHG